MPAPALFGVADYVPALMEYVERYGIALNFGFDPGRGRRRGKARDFRGHRRGRNETTVDPRFDMIHVVPPQKAPDFVAQCPLANAAGWVDVDQATLRHDAISRMSSALGDVMTAPNAKTAAAARKQAPVVAHNVLAVLGGQASSRRVYDGYGSCPLTVERGKIVLAEFGYGGKLLPTFPAWLDRRHQAVAAGLAAEGANPAVDLLARDAQGPRMAGRPELAGA